MTIEFATVTHGEPRWMCWHVEVNRETSQDDGASCSDGVGIRLWVTGPSGVPLQHNIAEISHAAGILSPAEFRRCGVFRQLFDHLKSKAIVRPDVIGIRLYVEKENSRARGTYASLGLNEEHYAFMALYPLAGRESVFRTSGALPT